MDFNFPNITAYPKFKIRCEAEKDLKALAERDAILIEKVGLPVAQKYFYDTYDIPEPSSGEVLVQGGSKIPAPAKRGRAREGATFARAKDQQADQLDPFVDRLMAEANLDPMIDPIEKLVQEAKSLEDLKDRLLNQYENIDPIRLGDLMQQALATAELLGRFEAEEKG